MIRFALCSMLVGLLSLPAHAQDAVAPDAVRGPEQAMTAPAAEARPAEQSSAPQTVAEPAPQNPTQAEAPRSNDQMQAAAPAASALPAASASGKAQKQAAVKPKPKHPRHAARKGPNSRVYYVYRAPRYVFGWAYPRFYGYYGYRPRYYRPGYYAYYGYYPGYAY